MLRSLLILLSLTLFVSCKKEAGEGGKAEIHGRIMEQRYSSINQLPTCQGERKTISIPLDIGDRKGVVEIGDLTVEKW